MRLIKPNPGELADRQTILCLKINNSDFGYETEDWKQIKPNDVRALATRTVAKSKVDISGFLDELELVQNHLLKTWIPSIENDTVKVSEYDKLYDELGEVNSQLWDLEDNARVLRNAPDKFKEQAAIRAAEVLFAITDLNDKRADIVRQINALWGFNIKEKLHI